MDELVKICPGCGAEYFAHVERCRECELTLVFPHDIERGAPVKGPVPEDGDAGLVVVEEGQLSRLAEIARALEGRGLPFRIARSKDVCDEACADPSKIAPSKKGAHVLLAPPAFADAVHQAIDAHWESIHPELKETKERLERGDCPACGTALMGAPSECPECGLNLKPGAPEEDDGCCH